MDAKPHFLMFCRFVVWTVERRSWCVPRIGLLFLKPVKLWVKLNERKCCLASVSPYWRKENKNVKFLLIWVIFDLYRHFFMRYLDSHFVYGLKWSVREFIMSQIATIWWTKAQSRNFCSFFSSSLLYIKCTLLQNLTGFTVELIMYDVHLLIFLLQE